MDFHQIYKHHYKIIFGFCYRMTGNMEIAKDISQETFTKLYELSLKEHQPDKILSWLYKVAGNRCLNHLKRGKMIRNVNRELDQPGIEYDNPEKMFIKNETIETMRNIINQLKPKQKMLILMYQDGFSYKELAKATEIPYNSIGKTLWRTIDLLSQKLKDIENG